METLGTASIPASIINKMTQARAEQAPPPAQTPAQVQAGQVAPPANGEAVKAVEAEKRDPIAKGFAELAKRERLIAKEKAEMADKLKGSEEYLKLKAAGTKDARKILAAFGLDLSHVNDQALQGFPEDNPQVEALRVELQAVKDQLSQKELDAIENEQKQLTMKEQEAVNKFKSDQKNFVTQNKDKFPILHDTGEFDTLYAQTEKMYQETGTVPTTEEVCAKLESELEAEIKKYLSMPAIKRLAGLGDEAGSDSKLLDAFKAKQQPTQTSLASKVASSTDGPASSTHQTQSKPTTLTHDMSVGNDVPIAARTDLSDSDKIRMIAQKHLRFIK